MRKLFHLYLKKENLHKYYGDLTLLFSENENLEISKFTLDRKEFEFPFENEICTIRKDHLRISFRKTQSSLK